MTKKYNRNMKNFSRRLFDTVSIALIKPQRGHHERISITLDIKTNDFMEFILINEAKKISLRQESLADNSRG